MCGLGINVTEQKCICKCILTLTLHTKLVLPVVSWCWTASAGTAVYDQPLVFCIWMTHVNAEGRLHFQSETSTLCLHILPLADVLKPLSWWSAENYLFYPRPVSEAKVRKEERGMKEGAGWIGGIRGDSRRLRHMSHRWWWHPHPHIGSASVKRKHFHRATLTGFQSVRTLCGSAPLIRLMTVGLPQ